MKTISLSDLQKSGENIERLPFSIRILLENALRNKDDFSITQEHVNTLLHWKAEGTEKEVPFKPARVLMQDFTGRSEEHTSELQSRFDLVCRLLLEKKKKS